MKTRKNILVWVLMFMVFTININADTSDNKNNNGSISLMDTILYMEPKSEVQTDKKKGAISFKINQSGYFVRTGFVLKNFKKPVNIRDYKYLYIKVRGDTQILVSRITFADKKYNSAKYEPDIRINTSTTEIRVPLDKLENNKKGGTLDNNLSIIYFELWMPKYKGKKYSLTIFDARLDKTKNTQSSKANRQESKKDQKKTSVAKNKGSGVNTVLASITKSDKGWGKNHKGESEIVIKNEGIEGAKDLVFSAGPYDEKTHYASITYAFPKELNFTGADSISFYIKPSGVAIPRFKIYLSSSEGKLGWDFIRGTKPAKNIFTKCVFPLTKIQSRKGKFDISKINKISIGFGLWELSKHKYGFKTIIDRIEVNRKSGAFIIPRPKSGMNIDGFFKDWGFEDNLYNWTPPKYIILDNENQVVPGEKKWKGKSSFSGKFSFMADNKNLYFLALVVDSTPREGLSLMPFENDSIELFLSFKADKFSIENGRKVGKDEIQIVFDCGKNGAKAITYHKGKKSETLFPVNLINKTWKINQNQSKGYVLEAAIPFKILRQNSFSIGKKIAYSIKLHNYKNVSLTATPENLKPHANVKAWKTAYYIEETDEEQKKIVFGDIAVNALWPDHLTENEGRIKIWDDQSSYKKNVSSSRERRYLNSLWAVQGVSRPNMSPDPKAWFYIPCPKGIGFDTTAYKLNKDRSVLGKEMPGISSFNKKVTYLWYERTFYVDLNKKQKKTFLVLEYAAKEAYIYLNKEYIGKIQAKRAPIDITEKLKYGKENRLNIFLYRGRKYSVNIRNGVGLTGDIYIEHHNYAPVIDNIWIKKASGINGSFEFVIETSGLTPNKKTEFVFNILDKKGKVLLRLKKLFNKSRITATGIYSGFKSWSPNHPVLYTLGVSCKKDGKIIDEKKQRFGFRSFEIKNARLTLNGKIFRIRATQPTYVGGVMEPGYFKQLKISGYNTIYNHASSHGYNNPLLNICDETGMITWVAIDKTQNDDQTIRDIKEYRNHPSVIMYITDAYGQFGDDGFHHNPFSVNDDYYPSSKKAIVKYNYLRKRYELFKSIDPTRLYLSQATGNFVGSIRNEHNYCAYGITLEDRAQYYEKWAKRKNPILPCLAVEIGTSQLFNVDTTHPVHKYKITMLPDNRKREVNRVLPYEMGSRYIGENVYDNWRKWDFLLMRATIRGLRSLGIDGFVPWDVRPRLKPLVNISKYMSWPDKRELSYKYFIMPWQKVLNDGWLRSSSWYFRLRAIPHWKWPGKYGWGDLKAEPSIYAPIYENEMQPLFAYIGGPERNYFSKEHNFYAGEMVEKQIIAVNDTENNQKLKIIYTLKINNKTIFKKKIESIIKQGGIIKYPFSFKAPHVSVKTKAIIKIDYLSEKGKKMTDEFSITIFPKKKVNLPGLGIIGLVSIEKDSILTKLNLIYKKVSLGKKLPKLDLLVIERNALTKDIKPEILENFIKNGGKVVIFEQSEKGLMDWRLKERRFRTLFSADDSHPLLKGLDNKDFSYWRGASDMVPAEKPPSKAFRHDQCQALPVFYLTQEGTVATYSMYRPSYGNFHTILACGYDLEEMALIEMKAGKGCVIWCQLDVTPRYGIEPAATILVHNIFRYLSKKDTQKQLIAAYLGDNKGENFLKKLGIKYIKKTKNADVIIVGGSQGNSKSIKSLHLKDGSVVVYLPTTSKRAFQLPNEVVDADKEVALTQMDYPGYHVDQAHGFKNFKALRPYPERLTKPVAHAFRGLLDNDTYFFSGYSFKPFIVNKNKKVKFLWKSAHSLLVEVVIDQTKYILCRINPTKLKHGECKRKAWRIWSQIFANLGLENKFKISFTPPGFDLSQKKWSFLTDPDNEGIKQGYMNGSFNGKKLQKIKTGKIWEDQGITDKNPNLYSPPDSSYDGVAWYFTKAFIPEANKNNKKLYFHIGGVRAGSGDDGGTKVWLNGKRVKKLLEARVNKMGGRGARLWEVAPDIVKFGKENFIAIRIENSFGPGGIHKNPVRFETEGQNADMIFPYEFVESKFNPYYHWVW